MYKTRSLGIISLILLTLIPIRGFFIYHFAFKANQIYIFSSVLLLILSVLCVGVIFKRSKNDLLVEIKTFVFWNYLLSGFYLLVTIFIVGFNQISIVYQFILFPVIFYLLTCENKELQLGIHIISFIILLGSYLFFSLGLNYGFEAISEANFRLRPDDDAYSRIGEIYLPGGYLGDHHDNANILAMSSAFYFSESFIKQNKYRFVYFLFFILSTSFLVISGSASNIVVFIVVVFCTLFFYNRKFLFLILIVSFFLFIVFEEYFYFLEKLKQDQSELEGGGIFNSLDIISFLYSIHTILFGFGDFFQPPMIKAEISFIKILISVGLIPFIFLMLIIFSPFFYIYKFNRNINLKISFLKNTNFLLYKKMSIIKKSYIEYLVFKSIPVITGSFTLLHYGSLFRITSICLFCLFLAIFFKTFLHLDKSFKEIFNSNF